jgi:hypothetical protein
MFISYLKIVEDSVVIDLRILTTHLVEQTTQRQKEEFEDTKGAIRIRISKKNKQHKGQ